MLHFKLENSKILKERNMKIFVADFVYKRQRACRSHTVRRRGGKASRGKRRHKPQLNGGICHSTDFSPPRGSLMPSVSLQLVMHSVCHEVANSSMGIAHLPATVHGFYLSAVCHSKEFTFNRSIFELHLFEREPPAPASGFDASSNF